MDALTLGRTGEAQAVRYLIKSGYLILFRNYRTKYGEIDIVSQDPAGVLIFAEVKSIVVETDPSKMLLPEDNLSRHKLHKLKRICSFFANANPVLAAIGWQIDLIALILEEGRWSLKHYRNV